VAVCSLASGSRGNSTFISDGTTSVLVDAGLSGVEIERRMKSRGLATDTINAIIVSHEHQDHIRGVGILSRRFGIPVYISQKTRLAAGSAMGKIPEIRGFECGDTFRINTLEIHPFSVPHDAADTAGFTIQRNGTRIGIATDLGMVTTVVRDRLRNCQILVLEANHDPEMLMTGPYPWHLKQRVKGRTGHLSNHESRDLIREIRHDHLHHVIIGHLSEQNNTPQRAVNVVSQALKGSQARLTVASQHICGEVIRI